MRSSLFATNSLPTFLLFVYIYIVWGGFVGGLGEEGAPNK